MFISIPPKPTKAGGAAIVVVVNPIAVVGFPKSPRVPAEVVVVPKLKEAPVVAGFPKENEFGAAVEAPVLKEKLVAGAGATPTEDVAPNEKPVLAGAVAAAPKPPKVGAAEEIPGGALSLAVAPNPPKLGATDAVGAAAAPNPPNEDATAAPNVGAPKAGAAAVGAPKAGADEAGAPKAGVAAAPKAGAATAGVPKAGAETAGAPKAPGAAAGAPKALGAAAGPPNVGATDAIGVPNAVVFPNPDGCAGAAAGVPKLKLEVVLPNAG